MLMNVVEGHGACIESHVSVADVVNADNLRLKVKEVLINHRSENKEEKKIYISDSDLEGIYKFLFEFTHTIDCMVNTSTGEEELKFMPLIETSNKLNINDIINI